MNIVINAVIAKKSSGGGFQLTCNFIRETLKNDDINWYYFVSEDIDNEIREIFKNEHNKTYFVFPTQPEYKTYFTVRKKIGLLIEKLNIDLVYSILAPSYFHFNCKEVMHCANAWNYVKSVNKYAWDSVSFKQSFKIRVKSYITCFLIKKNKYFITETETAKRSIIDVTHTSPDNIKVVPNVLPAIYLNSEWGKKKGNDIINIVYVAAPMPHKNLEIIPKVASILKNKYGLQNFKFNITIPLNNIKKNKSFYILAKKNGVSNYINNLGYQSQLQLIDLYSKCDIYFFPSLLETFSAALLEAMFFRLPIVASNFDFNQEVADDAALYFQPMSAEDAANKLYHLITDNNLYESMISKCKNRIQLYNDYTKYFKDTSNFLIDVAKL